MADTELSLQSSIVKYHDMVLAPRYGTYLFHVPNGTYIKNVATRSLMKRSGLKSGVADLCLMCRDGKSRFIEIKLPEQTKISPKTLKTIQASPAGKQSETQKTFEEICHKLGFKYVIIYSIDEFISYYEKEVLND